MIRKVRDTDINEITKIWLDTNIETHTFIPSQYWRDNFEAVKEMLLQAEIYVYEDEKANKLQGFIGLEGNYIAGIFVRAEVQSRGIGRQLLDFVKKIKVELALSVYKKNVRAVKFYQREKFGIYSEGIDKNTNEKEYLMTWEG